VTLCIGARRVEDGYSIPYIKPPPPLLADLSEGGRGPLLSGSPPGVVRGECLFSLLWSTPFMDSSSQSSLNQVKSSCEF
jgi:hypothetical protein